jgi:polyhydroxybutyrate depolymerase
MRSLLAITSLMLAIVASDARAQGRPASGASCELSRASGVSMQQLTSGQRPRGYRLFVPPGYDGHTRLPLVLDLHGSGGSSTGQARTSGFEALAGNERFLVATLDAEGARWNVPVQDGRADDVAYVADVIAHVGTLVCTDDARVYATGFSGGARMTSLLGCRLGSRLAAIAPVSGLRFSEPCPGKPVPVLTFHGLADPQNPYDGHAIGRGAEWEESVPDALAGWARHNSCPNEAVLDDPPGPLSWLRYKGCANGAEVAIVRIDGLGHTWTRKEIDTTRQIWEFFKSHRLDH